MSTAASQNDLAVHASEHIDSDADVSSSVDDVGHGRKASCNHRSKSEPRRLYRGQHRRGRSRSPANTSIRCHSVTLRPRRD